jgi:hypothetical protein
MSFVNRYLAQSIFLCKKCCLSQLPIFLLAGFLRVRHTWFAIPHVQPASSLVCAAPMN